MKADNDAARRVATSSEKRENRFETSVFQKGNRGERPLRFNRLLEVLLTGKEILITQFKFFEDRSDAACRVVVKTIGPHRWQA